MLLQSQEHVVAPLPALPAAWSEGSYRGLLARGNFEVSAQWSDGRASRLEVLSKSGGTLELRYPNVAQAVIKTPAGQTVNFVAKGSDQVRIETTQGQTYVVTDIPVCIPVIAPSNLKIDRDVVRNQIKLSWTGSADAASYNLYRAVGNAPDYELIASDVAGTDFVYKAPDLKQFDQMTLKVTAVRADGRESDEGAMVIRLLPQKVVVERWKAPKDGPGKWTLLSCKGQPDGRHETTFVECQGKFYLIGGRESRKIDRFDPQTKVWTKMKGTSPLIHHFQPVLWDNKIYMVGAMTGNYPKEPPMRRIQIYDPLRDQWTEGGEIPKARQRGSAGTVLYKNKIYMVGGITLGHTSGTNNWFDEYDPATDTWKILPDAPQIRDHFHAVVLDDKLYCIGGRNTSYHEPGNFAAFFGAVIREIDCYDFKTQTWTTLKAKLPVGSAAGGVAVLDGKIIYFGGETAQKGPALNRTWAFNPKTETWTELANLNQGRHGSQAIVYDNKVYIAAGSPNRGGGQTHTMEMFAF